MRFNIFKTLIALVAIAFIFPSITSATGPRVTTALFATDKDEIHAVDFPPFVSSEVVDGGVLSEVVSVALARAKIDAVISTHPVKRMLRYYLFQEDALAVIGWHFQFSEEQMKNLIMIPLTSFPENYYYYKPSYPNGLSLEKSKLKGLRHGAHKGERPDYLIKAGVEIYYGRTINLLKKLKNNELDFICAPPKAVEWFIDRYLHEDRENFVSTNGEYMDDQTYYIVFNRKHPDGKKAAEDFKQALAGLLEDGTYSKISEKHLGADQGKLFLKRLETIK